MSNSISVNGRDFLLPTIPTVGICLDGTSWEYLAAAADHMPNLQRMIRQGAAGTAHSVVPSFTNPNNMAIATGVPPVMNGICGNYYYDPESGEEVMMNDPSFLTTGTLFAAMAEAGQELGVITVKDKLRRLLGHGMKGICFSGEKADQATREENGIDRVTTELIGRAQPGIYDPELSVYCFEAAVKLQQAHPRNLLYVTTTDFVQHKYKPEAPEAIAFLAALDRHLGELDALGMVIGITADHGMNDKVRKDGSPKVVFAETLLAAAGIGSRVILPITDPYVVHHGSLGSYGTVYLADLDQTDDARMLLEAAPGIELVLSREEAAEAFDLPANRIGDLVVLSDQHTVIGRREDWHNLSVVEEGLRSHGGLHESEVPLIINRPLKPGYALRLASGQARNYDLFDFLLNGLAS